MGESAFRFSAFDVADCGCSGICFPGAKAGVGRRFLTFFGRGAWQLLSDGRDQLHDRDLRNSAEIDPGAHSREILADRVTFRIVDSHGRFFRRGFNECLPGCRLSTSPTPRCRFTWANSIAPKHFARLRQNGSGWPHCWSWRIFGGTGRCRNITIHGG